MGGFRDRAKRLAKNRKGKKVYIRSYGYISVDRKVGILWDDIYISYTTKPRRTKHYLSPCIVSKTNLLSDIEYEDGCELVELENILEYLKDHNFCISTMYSNTMPNLYTSADYIDRAEAERMIREYMKTKGFENIRLYWKRSKWCIGTM